MEMNQYVNKKYADEFLESEIKEISERWAKFKTNQLALERILSQTTLSQEELQDYEDIKNALSNVERDKRKNAVPNFWLSVENDKRNNYEKVKEYKRQEGILEETKKGLKEFEEFLEVTTQLKKDINYAEN